MILPPKKNKNLLYIDKDIQRLFYQTKEEVKIYAKPLQDKARQQVEFSLKKEEFVLFKNMFSYLSQEEIMQIYSSKGQKKLTDVLPAGNDYNKTVKFPSSTSDRQTLSGIRIAIDPGHTAGDLKQAQLEQKIVNIEVQDKKKSKLISFYESELAFDTATILADWLRKDGANVFVTKKAKGMTAFSLSFQDWKKKAMPAALKHAYKTGKISKKYKEHLQTKASDEEIFHKFFVKRELNERARLINNFHPHITIIIHYNILPDQTFWQSKGTRIGITPINYSLSFVPGGLESNYMKTPEDRIQLLRLLLTNDLKNSIDFCSDIQHSFAEVLKVPAFTGRQKGWLQTEVAGIYARNLRLTRRVYGTLCFGESLLQNNKDEYQALSKKDAVYRGKKISQRILDNARAYYQGIHAYVNKKNGY